MCESERSVIGPDVCLGVPEPEPLALLGLKPATLLYTGELHAGEQDDSRKAACHGMFQWIQRLWANHTPVATGHFFSGSFSPSSEPPITDAPSSCWDLKLWHATPEKEKMI